MSWKNFKTLLVQKLLPLKGALQGLRQFLAIESPLKMMKNAFYFTLKTFSFSRYLNVCLGFLVKREKGLIRKIRLISEFMTSQTANQTIAIHILLNISGSKNNQTMKFVQLTGKNMKNIFLKKMIH